MMFSLGQPRKILGRCLDWGDLCLGMLLVCMACATCLNIATHWFSEPESVQQVPKPVALVEAEARAADLARRVQVQKTKVSVEEARYMLECVLDWGLTGDECRAVLHGGNPPPYDGAPGCGC